MLLWHLLPHVFPRPQQGPKFRNYQFYTMQFSSTFLKKNSSIFPRILPVFFSILTLFLFWSIVFASSSPVFPRLKQCKTPRKYPSCTTQFGSTHLRWSADFSEKRVLCGGKVKDPEQNKDLKTWNNTCRGSPQRHNKVSKSSEVEQTMGGARQLRARQCVNMCSCVVILFACA